MAGNSDEDSQECSFVWDEASQLYFHASTGFYHDPNAGWYYSSGEGVYYKFEDGNYVPLQFDMLVEGETCEDKDTASQNPFQDKSCSHANANGTHDCLPSKGESSGDCFQEGNQPDNSYPDSNGAGSNAPEIPPPPSEWLEDTLIELYLSNYSNPINEGDARDGKKPSETSDNTSSHLLSNEDDDVYELEEGEWIPEEDSAPLDSGETILHEEVNEEEEENWKAQYGQFVPPAEEEKKPSFHCTDLWDWTVVKRPKKDGKKRLARLVGRLVKQSAKLHPSVPAGGGVVRTAPVWQVRSDLVRVRTGKIYKLRTPSARCLTSLASYDSSNPTKDWGFPEIPVDGLPSSKLISRQKNDESVAEDGAGNGILPKETPSSSCQQSASEKHKSHVYYSYRDRAAERRSLHGGFGIGPGQKNPCGASEDGGSEEEVLDMSFGTGSYYARKVMENMGWKQGEGLGSSKQGLREPIQAVGNIGSTGLGWPHPQPLGRTRRKTKPT